MQSTTANPTRSGNPSIQILAPAQGEALNFMGGSTLIKNSDPRAPFIVEQALPPGHHVPLHFHEEEDESFFVLDGNVTFEGENGSAQVISGGFVHCPRGSRHSFRNESDRPARILVVASAGGGLGPMFREFDRIASIGAGLTPNALTAIAEKNGIKIL